MRSMAFLLMMALLVIIAGEGVTLAATYKWEDTKGAVSFTDNPESIPLQYRNKAKKIDMDEPAAPAEPVAEPPVQQETTGGTDQTPTHEQSSSQEKGREYWQLRYKALRGELKTISDGLPGKKERMSEYRHKWLVTQKRSERQSLNQIEDDIVRDEERIKELERELEQLDVEASRNAVPFEWRQ